MNKSISPTTLSDAQFDECVKFVIEYLSVNTRVRNKDIRKATSIGYDQAIYFFNRAISEGVLVRKGKGGGVHYVLPTEGDVI